MPSRREERVEFMSGGQKVIGVLSYGTGRITSPSRVVITCHGLMSSKDSEKYLQIAERFSTHGIPVLRFDFRGSGESDGSGNLLSNRIMDLNAAIKFVIDLGHKSIGLLGSSYGGATAILVASENTAVRCLTTWSTPCKLTELFGSMKERSQEPLSAEIETDFQPSFMQYLSRHDVAEAAKKVQNILVVHCKGDEVVPWSQARTIYNNAKQPKRLRIFEGGDHQLLEPAIRRDAIELSLGWMISYL